jgi:hypothetical protein
MILQSPANLQRASGRLFRAVKEKERHSVSGRYSNELATCFCHPETFGASDDLIEFLEQFNLLIDQQFRITHRVDEQKMCDLEREIGLSPGQRVLGIHPLQP